MALTAAIQALRDDADLWQTVAGATDTAAHEAAGLTLGVGELSWASLPTGLLETYAEIQGKVATLLGEATTTFTGLSVTLDRVAADYERSDADAARRLQGTWDVRD